MKHRTAPGPHPLHGLSTLAAAAALAAAAWSTDALGQQIGHVDERFGHATYSILIVTPPGTGGTGPRLSLEYRSSDGKGGAGYLGFGWRLAGLSVIERNARRGVPFDYDAGRVCNQGFCYLDDFVLDDQDLVCEDLSCGGRYRTRTDDGTRIEYRGESSGWEIQDRSGTRYRYGSSAESRIRNHRNGQVLSWLLERVEDAHGNWIEYHYDRDSSPGSAYPSSIEYAQAGAAANRRVVFRIEPREDRAIDYSGGLRREIDRRIHRIEVYAANDELVTAYELDYRQSGGSGRSLLISVQRRGSDDTTTLPPHRFSYSERSVSQQEAGHGCKQWSGEVVDGFEEEWVTFNPDFPPRDLGMPDSGGNRMSRSPIDLNRDGLIDMFLASGEEGEFAWVDMLPGDGSVFGEEWLEWSRAPTGPHQDYAFLETSSSPYVPYDIWVEKAVLDIDGDGYPDHVASEPSYQGATILGSPEGFTGPDMRWAGGPGTIDISPGSIDGSLPELGRGVMDSYLRSDLYLSLLDLNADGRPDQVASKHQWQGYDRFPDANAWLVSLNQGRSEDGESIGFSDSAIQWDDPFGLPISSEREHTYTVDVNGDGLPDRIQSDREYQDNPPPGLHTYTWHVAYNNGAGFDQPEPEVFFEETTEGGIGYHVRCPDGHKTLADFFDINGDGFPDHVMIGEGVYGGPDGPPYYWRVRYGTGSGLGPTVVWDGASPECIGDDCFPPSCSAYEADWWSQLRIRGESRLPQDFADFNGDGLLDVFRGDDHHIRLNEGPTIDLLVAGTQPLGGTIAFEYDYSTRMKNEMGEPANPGLGRVLPIVVKTTTSDGRGVSPDIVTSYHYGDGVYDHDLEIFLGFGRVVRTEEQSDRWGEPADLLVTSTYRTDASCPGMPITREFSSGGTVFSLLSWQFGSLGYPDDAPAAIDQWHACLLAYESTETIEGNVQESRARQVEYTYGYDPRSTHFNPTRIRHWGEVEKWSDAPPTYLEITGGTLHDNRITFLEYAVPDDPDSHVVSRVSRRTVQPWGSSRPDEEKHGYLDMRFYYDGLPLGQVGAGLQTGVERWQTYPIGDPNGQPRDAEWIATKLIGYDGFGNAETVTGPPTGDDPDGYQTKTVYDSTYQTFPVDRIAGSDLESPLITHLDYTASACVGEDPPPPGLGLVCATTDPSGITTRLRYDPLGRVDRIEHPGGLIETRSYRLAEPNQVAESLLTTTHDLGAGVNLTYHTWLDGLGRAYQTESPGKQAEIIRTTRTRDDRGRLATETIPHFISPPPDTILKRSFSYDTLGRTKSITGYDGETQTVWSYATEHDVWATVEEVYFGDPNQTGNRQSRVERSIDAYGNLVKVVSHEGKETLGAPFIVTAEYDQLNRLRYVFDPIANDPSLCSEYNMGDHCQTQAHWTTVTYDGLGRRVKLVDPDSATWRFYYDAAGLLQKRLDGAGRTQEFDYDLLQRKIARRFGPSGLGTSDAGFTYQNDPDRPDFGRLVAVQADTSYTYDYDDNTGQLVTREQLTDGYVFTDTFAYDALGRVTTRIYPDGESFANVYDGTRHVGITGGMIEILIDAEYDALGRTELLEMGYTEPAATIEREYDPYTAQLVRMLVQGHNDPPDDPSMDLDVEFDGLSRLKTQSVSYQGSDLKSRSFKYDGLGRLEQAIGPWEKVHGYAEPVTWDFAYDPLGNLRSQISSSEGQTYQYERTWEYDHARKPRLLTHFVTSVGATRDTDHMTAEAGGNLAAVNGGDYVWNAQNRLHVTPEGSTALYDAFDNRVVYMPNDTDTVIYYVGSDFEYDYALEQSTKFFFVNGERIASRAVAGYTPDTAWTLSWPYRRIVKPAAPAAYPVCSGLLLLGLAGIAGISFRRRDPAWLTVPGIGLLCFGLVIYPIHPALAVSGGGSGPTWHGGHSEWLMIYGNDHLGSTRVVLNKLGETVETRDYAPFGERISYSGQFELKHQFTGQPYDDTTDLYYYGARMYKAEWGRFISPDERVEGLDSQGLNPYAYVRNQPTSLVDPTGEFIDFGGFGGLGTLAGLGFGSSSLPLVRSAAGYHGREKAGAAGLIQAGTFMQTGLLGLVSILGLEGRLPGEDNDPDEPEDPLNPPFLGGLQSAIDDTTRDLNALEKRLRQLTEEYEREKRDQSRVAGPCTGSTCVAQGLVTLFYSRRRLMRIEKKMAEFEAQVNEVKLELEGLKLKQDQAAGTMDKGVCLP